MGQSVLLAAAQKTAEISLPVAITVFPEEVYRAPETWARRAYRNLIYFNEVDKGGHFAAWEAAGALQCRAPRRVQAAPQIDLKTSAARCARRLPCASARNIDRNPEGHSSMKTSRLLVAVVLAIAIGAPIAGFLGAGNVAQPTTSPGMRVPFFHAPPTAQIPGQSGLASLEQADEWLNSPPLTPSALRGKVVLIDFWTYTCINWLRTLPYVRAWAEKYRDQGLVVIGVHAPEFAFEKNVGQRSPGRERHEDRLPGRGRQ